jgi:DNA-directed RNA polymerase subunit RPC12/RpoP
MKISDFIERKGVSFTEDECTLCALHTAFNTEGEMECPKCGTQIFIDDAKMTVVGESNTLEPDEEIKKMPMLECPCGAHIALMPTEITWNANHDVYYTGGRKYVIGDIVFKHKLLPSIQQYHDRIIKGEKLEPWNLEVWLQYDIQGIIADYLFKNGFKK